MNKEMQISRTLLRFAVIAIVVMGCMLAGTSRDAYAAQEKYVPFEKYMPGIEDGIAVMNTWIIIDLEDLCTRDSDIAAQYRKAASNGYTIKAYTKGVVEDTLNTNIWDGSDPGYIYATFHDPINYSGLKFRIYIEIGDWTFYSSEITLLYNINMANYSEFKDKTYNGKPQTQDLVITTRVLGLPEDVPLVEGRDYTVSYSNNTNAGTASVTFKGITENLVGGECTKTFTIKKAANNLKASGKTAKVKYSKLKKNKQTIKADKAFTIKKKIGKVTYKKLSGNKKITVSKAGNVTVKKGLKKGTYPVKVRVTAAGDKNHMKATKKVTMKVKVQ